MPIKYQAKKYQPKKMIYPENYMSEKEWTEAQENDIPVLIAQENIEGYLTVWCPFCKVYHYHGMNAGHRVAHCSSDKSPCRSSIDGKGYYITLPPRDTHGRKYPKE